MCYALFAEMADLLSEWERLSLEWESLLPDGGFCPDKRAHNSAELFDKTFGVHPAKRNKENATPAPLATPASSMTAPRATASSMTPAPLATSSSSMTAPLAMQCIIDDKLHRLFLISRYFGEVIEYEFTGDDHLDKFLDRELKYKYPEY